MTPLEPVGPNSKQIEYWNAAAGAKWVSLQGMLDRMIDPHGEAAIARARVHSGQVVLDVGCGCGATSVALARGVDTTGHVTGIDVSTRMLARAAELASEAGASNVTFENADAQTHAFARDTVDLIYSRFGVMFFSDPRTAFSNLFSALKPGGGLSFVCWQSIADNPWMALPTMAAMQVIELELPADPRAPGPFAFADPGYVRGFLSGAGFAAIEMEPMVHDLWVGGAETVEQAVSFLMTIGPVGAQLDQHSDEVRERVADAVRGVLEPYARPDGVRMPSAAWLVTAAKR